MLRAFLAFTLLVTLAGPARAKSSCFYYDTSPDQPVLKPVACPEVSMADKRLPELKGMVWVKKPGTTYYRTEVLLRQIGAEAPQPRPIAAHDTYSYDAMDPTTRPITHINLDAEDYMNASRTEKMIGRAKWALSYASRSLDLSVKDYDLRVKLQRGLYGTAGDASAAASELSTAKAVIMPMTRAPEPAPAAAAPLKPAGPLADIPTLATPLAPVAANPEAPTAPTLPQNTVIGVGLAAALLIGLGVGGWFARATSTGDTSRAPTIVDGPASTRITTTVPVLPSLSHYDIQGKIGEGGMGLVFAAVRREDGVKVAIKQMRDEIRGSAAARERFKAEAEIISRLKHPRIVHFHEMAQQGDDLFLVFDLVEGKPLSQLLEEKKRLDPHQTRRIFTQVCEAMSSAHRERVLHRDLKPSNIMVEPSGTVKVMDFGIARQAKDTVTHLTRTDASGTMAYMAPEQHLGRCAKASDIYALGVCLYETLTGRLPFPGPDFLAQKERMDYPAPQFVVPQLPKEAELLFKVTLAVAPEKRVADAEELIESLKCLG